MLDLNVLRFKRQYFTVTASQELSFLVRNPLSAKMN